MRALHPLEMGEQVFHGLAVQFHHHQVQVVALQQVLRQHAHSGSYLQHVAGLVLRVAAECVHYGPRDVLVREEMLPEGFFRSYFHRSGFH